MSTNNDKIKLVREKKRMERGVYMKINKLLLLGLAITTLTSISNIFCIFLSFHHFNQFQVRFQALTEANHGHNI